MEMLELIAKCVFFYVVIVVSLRVMGKREVGELSVLDVVIYFVMSELLALSISEPDQSVGKALVAIATLSVLQISIAWACLKKKRWRDFFEGQPSLIIYDGIINQKEMKRQRYTIDDLMYQLRDRDISSPQEVQFAILENSGTLTVLKKDSSKLRWMDPLISDGIVQTKVLTQIGKDTAWLEQQLSREGVVDPSEVFLCLWQKNGLFVLKKTMEDPTQMKQRSGQHSGDQSQRNSGSAQRDGQKGHTS